MGLVKVWPARSLPHSEKLEATRGPRKNTHGPFTLLVFATPRKVTKDAEKEWADKVRDEFALELVVISRAEIIASLQVPANAWMCRTHLRIAVPYQSPITDTLRLIREAATEEADLGQSTRG